MQFIPALNLQRNGAVLQAPSRCDRTSTCHATSCEKMLLELPHRQEAQDVTGSRTSNTALTWKNRMTLQMALLATLPTWSLTKLTEMVSGILIQHTSTSDKARWKMKMCADDRMPKERRRRITSITSKLPVKPINAKIPWRIKIKSKYEDKNCWKIFPIFPSYPSIIPPQKELFLKCRCSSKNQTPGKRSLDVEKRECCSDVYFCCFHVMLLLLLLLSSSSLLLSSSSLLLLSSSWLLLLSSSSLLLSSSSSLLLLVLSATR